MKKFILLFIVSIIAFSSQSFSGKEDSQRNLSTSLKDDNKNKKLSRSLKTHMKSTHGTTFYIPLKDGQYDPSVLPGFLKKKAPQNSNPDQGNT